MDAVIIANEATEEAPERGAFNVVHKVPNYYILLSLHAERAITEFNDKLKLYSGVKTLKHKIDDLEFAANEGA